jgi:putative copper resistance protein D
MVEAFIACRLVHFASTMMAFGGSAFRLYAVGGGDHDLVTVLDAPLRRVLLVTAILALLSALLLVPFIGSTMAGSASAALDWKTISTVLLDTSFGRVWRRRLLGASLFVLLCAVRSVQAAYRVALSALLLMSLGWVGHAAAEKGGAGFGHEINQSVHLLAGGIWLGGLVPLAWLVVQTLRSQSERWFVLLWNALARFSRMGYVAVALVALTGIVNTILLVGSIDDLTGTPYGRVLVIKVALFLLLVAVAIINRFALVPWISREARASRGTTALLWTVGIEQMLGLAIIAVASVLGTLPPAIHTGDMGMHHH